jgi:hypothetical protein
MSTFSLRRFANQEILKFIRKDHLISLFDHHRTYFADRGVSLKHKAAEELDYYGIARVLMTPDETTPRELVDDLFFVDEMATPEGKVFVFERPDEVWMLVRHGDPCKREGALEASGSSSVYYRPEVFDVIRYDRGTALLATTKVVTGRDVRGHGLPDDRRLTPNPDGGGTSRSSETRRTFHSSVSAPSEARSMGRQPSTRHEPRGTRRGRGASAFERPIRLAAR